MDFRHFDRGQDGFPSSVKVRRGNKKCFVFLFIQSNDTGIEQMLLSTNKENQSHSLSQSEQSRCRCRKKSVKILFSALIRNFKKELIR